YGGDPRLGSYVAGVYADGGGNLWVRASAGVWRWRPEPSKFYPIAEGEQGVFQQALLEDDTGAMLVPTTDGIRRLADVGSVMAYPVPSSMRPFRADHAIRDRDGGVWVGGSAGGILHMHRGMTDTFAQSIGLSNDVIHAFWEDREGSIWV